jgi:hypothetical protein
MKVQIPMKLRIKEIKADIELKNNGMEIEVREEKEDGARLGDIIIARAGITWCKGKVGAAKGIKLSWKEFIAAAEAIQLSRAPAGKKAKVAKKVPAVKKAAKPEKTVAKPLVSVKPEATTKAPKRQAKAEPKAA